MIDLCDSAIVHIEHFFRAPAGSGKDFCVDEIEECNYAGWPVVFAHIRLNAG